MPRIWKIALATLPLFLPFAICNMASAEDQAEFSVECAETPSNLNFVRTGIRERARELVDQDTYTRIRVSVRMNKRSLDTPPVLVTSTSAISGLSMIDAGAPTGLSFEIEGEASYTQECLYTYRVVIGIRARAIETATVVRSSTSSLVTIRDRNTGSYRKVRR